MIRIIIADDHAIVRGGLRQILATTADIKLVGEATNGDEVRQLARQSDFDMLLLDMSMPGVSGVELIRRILEDRPGLPILILSMHNEGQIISGALKAGAAGYVTKDSDPETLLAAVRKVATGGKFIDPALVDTVVFAGEARKQYPHESLSEREIQILTMITAGQPLGEIADRLHLSPKTVSTHKMRLMQKLGIDNNADLVRYAMQHGLA
jgi:DNA-binding NarL/FixJ family response regulator